MEELKTLFYVVIDHICKEVDSWVHQSQLHSNTLNSILNTMLFWSQDTRLFMFIHEFLQKKWRQQNIINLLIAEQKCSIDFDAHEVFTFI